MVQASAESKEGIQQARLTPRECNELYTELHKDGGCGRNFPGGHGFVVSYVEQGCVRIE